MASARELASPLLGIVVRVPGSETHSCEVCHSSVGTYARCYPCNEAYRFLGGDVPLVLPITLSAERSQMHHVLRNYKDNIDQNVRARFTMQLAGLLELFASRHAGCIGDFDLVTCIPSRKQRTAFAGVVTRLGRYVDRYQELLVVASEAESHALSSSRFEAEPSAAGRRVLVIDDTFTTGASVFSAVQALRSVGATVGTILVVGRHINPAYGPTAQMLADMQGTPWDERECICCRPLSSLF